MKNLKVAQNIVIVTKKKYLDSTNEVFKLMSFNLQDYQNTESDVLLSQSSISISREPSKGPIISLELEVNFIEIADLRRAFAEGFAGYSVEILSKECRSVTKPVDVDGNKAIWNFKSKL